MKERKRHIIITSVPYFFNVNADLQLWDYELQESVLYKKGKRGIVSKCTSDSEPRLFIHVNGRMHIVTSNVSRVVNVTTKVTNYLSIIDKLNRELTRSTLNILKESV